MFNAVKRVQEKGLTNIRCFEPQDTGLLWGVYKSGRLPQLAKGLEAEEFSGHIEFLIGSHDSHWIVEDSGVAVGAMFIRTDGWTIQPHVEFFKGVSPAAIYRSYMTFFSDLKGKDFQGQCEVRCLENVRGVFNRMVMRGVLEYVGEIKEGSPSGTLYIYCSNKKGVQL